MVDSIYKSAPLRERQRESETELIERVLESFGGVRSKARVETPSLSKYYLRQQPPTAARGEREERRAIDSRHTPSITSHPALSLCLSVPPQRSKSEASQAAHYSADH